MNKRQLRAMKIAAQQALVNGAAGRELTAEESAQFDTLQREIDALTLEIEAEERQQSQAAGSGQAAAGAAADPQQRDLGGQGDAATRAVAAERQRVQDISDLCREFETDPGEYIRTGATIDQVRAAILEGMRQTGSPTSVQVTRDEGDTFRQRATDALILRAGIQIQHPAEGCNEFRAMSLRDLAIECLSREGQNTGALLRMSSDDLYGELCRQFYNPSAAFPAILDSTIRKSIVELDRKSVV